MSRMFLYVSMSCRMKITVTAPVQTNIFLRKSVHVVRLSNLLYCYPLEQTITEQCAPNGWLVSISYLFEAHQRETASPRRYHSSIEFKITLMKSLLTSHFNKVVTNDWRHQKKLFKQHETTLIEIHACYE